LIARAWLTLSIGCDLLILPLVYTKEQWQGSPREPSQHRKMQSPSAWVVSIDARRLVSTSGRRRFLLAVRSRQLLP
jgi:hypothetical protein